MGHTRVKWRRIIPIESTQQMRSHIIITSISRPSRDSRYQLSVLNFRFVPGRITRACMRACMRECERVCVWSAGGGEDICTYSVLNICIYIYVYLSTTYFMFFLFLGHYHYHVYNNPTAPAFILATPSFSLSATIWVRYYLWVYVARTNAQSFLFLLCNTSKGTYIPRHNAHVAYTLLNPRERY